MTTLKKGKITLITRHMADLPDQQTGRERLAVTKENDPQHKFES